MYAIFWRNINTICKLIHLTDRGLLPYNIQKHNYYNKNNDDIKYKNDDNLQKKKLTKELIKSINENINISTKNICYNSDDSIGSNESSNSSNSNDSSNNLNVNNYDYNKELFNNSIFKC